MNSRFFSVCGHASGRAPRLLFAVAQALCLTILSSSAAHALTVRDVSVVGVEDELLDNVLAKLELSRVPSDKVITEATLAYQLRRVPKQVADALAPFGYYSPEVVTATTRDGKKVAVQIQISQGSPTRVTESKVQLIGDGDRDVVLGPLVRNFRPKVGKIFRHSRYEDSKADIQRTFLSRGYFGARAENARVEVERATQSARIDLAWKTGPRYLFGETRISGSHLREEFLRPLIPYREGDFYSQAELLKLHRALVELDYFGLIDIQPDVRSARPGGPDSTVESSSAHFAEEEDDGAEVVASDRPPSVPIQVELTPAKRSRYSAGLSFGTDNGAALRLGLDRRYVNDRGHKIKADTEVGQRRSLIGVQYRIPELVSLPGWWNAGLSVRQEEIGGGLSDIGILSLARTARWRGNQIAAEINIQHEQFENIDSLGRVNNDTLLVYPALRLDRVEADDVLNPQRGYSLSTYVRVGSTAFGSDIDFAQAGLSAKWIRGLGDSYRVVLRGELATTWVSDFSRLPPSLRNYAGGDRSVRGYGYQELSPRDPLGEPAGARHLAVASAELERRLSEQWGVAAFVDAGNAFDREAFEPALGVGLGLRWRSPVGPVRIDLGHGLDQPEQGVRIHIGIGPEL